MNTVDLKFHGTYTPPLSGAVPLAFGPDAPVLTDPAVVTFLLNIPAPVWTCSATYASNTLRPFGPELGTPWQQGASESNAGESGWGLAQQHREQSAEQWEDGIPLDGFLQMSHSDLDKSFRDTRGLWDDGIRTSSDEFHERFVAGMEHFPHYARGLWQDGKPTNTLRGESYVQLDPSYRQTEVLLWGEAVALSKSWDGTYAPGVFFQKFFRLPWEQAHQPQSGREYHAPDTPVTPPYEFDTDLNFVCKWVFMDALHVLLNFAKEPCPYQTRQVPVRKAYIIVNNLSMIRVSDGEPVTVQSLSVGIDYASWCWSLSATIAYSDLDKVEPTMSGPVEVEVTINTLKWRFIVESFSEGKEFVKTTVNISGRSVTALLDNPYAPVRSYSQDTDMYSRQIAEAELNRPGLVSGFDIDWQLIDALGWSMPAHTYSYNDLTPMQVIQALAQGAGGFVNSDPLSKTILVKPEYPVPYWDWATATPDRIIPTSIVKRRSLQWNEKPSYNGVYVSGENTGVTAFVKKFGTDGAFQAPMYVSPMISDSAAARNKGISILSGGGKQAGVTMETPLHTALGLMTPGLLIEVTDPIESSWRGLVRSATVTATWQHGLTVTQAIDVERHYGGFGS